MVALGLGLVAGLVISGVWPSTPLHTVATDRTDSFAIATGAVDADVEAVYLLDFLTGDLRAFVVGQKAGSFTGLFYRNVAVDLGVNPQNNPKYMMVTGLDHMRREGGTRMQPSSAFCYVVEVTTGKMAAYAIPWSPSMYAANQPNVQELALVVASPIHPQAAPAGNAPAGRGQKAKAKE
jgi:hypothetical protein